MGVILYSYVPKMYPHDRIQLWPTCVTASLFLCITLQCQKWIKVYGITIARLVIYDFGLGLFLGIPILR